MIVRVLFFAYLRERCGVREVAMEVPSNASVADLWGALSARYPALEGQRLRFAVNQEYVDNRRTLHDKDELALIPPVSGGIPGPTVDAARTGGGFRRRVDPR